MRHCTDRAQTDGINVNDFRRHYLKQTKYFDVKQGLHSDSCEPHVLLEHRPLFRLNTAACGPVYRDDVFFLFIIIKGNYERISTHRFES